MSRKTVWRLLAILVVGVVVFAVPLSAAADDGGGSGGTAQVAIPGLFSLLMGSGGTSEGGALVIGPVQFDLASLNSTAKVEGLTFGNGNFDWNAVSITQKSPSAIPGAVVSDAQATVRGPSTGYTSNATAHVALQPGQAVQGEATVGVAYDGITRQLGVMVGDANLAVNTPGAGVEVRNLNTGFGTLSADEVRVTSPKTGGGVTVSGLQTGSAGTSWQGLQVYYPEVQLGNSATLSDLTLIVHGPSQSYGTEGSVQVEIKAGDLGSVQGQIGMMYDPSTGKFYAALSDGTATLATEAMQVQLSGISYSGSTLTIDTVSIAMPPLRLEGEISGVTVGGGNAVDFEQAWVRYLPDPAAGGSFNGVQFTVQKANGSYLLTTQAMVTPVAQK